MGKRGVKPQPSNVRRLTGDTRPSRTPPPDVPAPQADPDPPAWWDEKEADPESLREVWARVHRYLRSLKIHSDVDTDMVRAYVEAVVLMDRLAKVLLNAPAVVRDTNGMPAANPLMTAFNRQANVVKVLGGQFGLAGPSSRAGLGGRELVVGSEARRDDLAG